MSFKIRVDHRLLRVTPEPPNLYNHLGYMHRSFGGEPEWRFLGQCKDGTFSTLPGFLNRVLDWMNQRGHEYELETASRPELDLSAICMESQRESGKELIGGLAHQKNGVILGPCGIGKTHIIKAIIEASPVGKILVTTDGVVAARQLHSDLTRLLPHKKIGVWCTGKRTQPQEVTVVTNESMEAINKSKGYKERGLQLQDFQLWVADEVHTLPTAGLLATLSKISAPLRFGLTATLNRKDGAEALVEGYIGPVLSEVTHTAGVVSGDVAGVKVYVFPVPRIEGQCRLKPDQKDWRIASLGLVHYKPLHYLVAKIAEMIPKDGGHIIFADWIRYCRILHKSIPSSRILHAGMGSNKIDDAKNELRTSADACIIATDVIQKAFDAPPVKYITMAGIGSITERVQRIGRATRVFPGKTNAQVHDFLHMTHPALFQASINMILKYKELGWNPKILATREGMREMLSRSPYLNQDISKIEKYLC